MLIRAKVETNKIFNFKVLLKVFSKSFSSIILFIVSVSVFLDAIASPLELGYESY